MHGLMRRVILFLCCLAFCSSPTLAADETTPFEFLVMGCMPYYMPQDEARFQNVIAAANQARPAFSVHCGDTKNGQKPCDDAVYPKILGWFNQFEHPFIYVPGDNEWTDCHTMPAGAFDPVDRLGVVRRTFFSSDHLSLGKARLPLTCQSAVQPEFATYIEHNRWSRGGILFATLHVVGSNNNARENNDAAMAEFLARDKAVLAWMNSAFEEASKPECRALVLFMQANPLSETQRSEPRGTGFANVVPALRKAVQALPKPVYLFHADSHYFRIDKPLTSATGRMLENFTRIETFGGMNLHLIQVKVDPANPEPLVASPLMIPANKVDPNLPPPSRK
jgi:hypothetical protein